MDNSKPIAVITGASTGIGEQISLKLSSNNFHVILISRSKDKLLKVKEQIEDLGNQCQIIVADISKLDLISHIKDQIKFPENVQVLVNNAGIGIFNKFEDGVVYISMRGSCDGCPASTMTLKNGVENLLKHYVPEVESVVPLQNE